MTQDKIRKMLLELFEEAPELGQGTLSLDEARAWIDEMYREFRIDSENPSKNLLHLILRLQTTRHRLEILDRIKVLVPSELEESRVVIHDWHRDEHRDDREWPRATIMRHDPDQSSFCYIPVEDIDIVRSVQKDPAAVRHFAIQIAIQRWVNIVRYYYRFPAHSGEVEVKRKKGTKYSRRVRSEHLWYKIAAHHIRRIGGQAILEQAKKDALPMEVAILVHNITLLRDQEQYLPAVWELLRSREIQSKNRELEQLKALRNGLEARKDSFPTVICGPLHDDGVGMNCFKFHIGKLVLDLEVGAPLPVAANAKHIFAFLQETQGSGFLQSPSKLRSIRRAFKAWYLDLEPETVDKYFKEAERKVTKAVAEYSFDRQRCLYPTLWNSYSLSEFVNWDSPFDWFSPPTVSTNDQ